MYKRQGEFRPALRKWREAFPCPPGESIGTGATVKPSSGLAAGQRGEEAAPAPSALFALSALSVPILSPGTCPNKDGRLRYDRGVRLRTPVAAALPLLALVASGALLPARPAVAQGVGEAPRKIARTAARVDPDRLAATTASLASKEYEGRLAGSPGYDRAAAMASAHFRSLRLLPGGSAGYLQKLDVEYAEIKRCELAAANEEGSLLSLRHGADFTCRGLTASGAFAAPVVFAGYGISRPDLGWDDYEGLDAKGKVCLLYTSPSPRD